MFNHSDKEELVSYSNLCLFSHIIKLIRDSAKKWERISKNLENLNETKNEETEVKENLCKIPNPDKVTELQNLLEYLFWAMKHIAERDHPHITYKFLFKNFNTRSPPP